MTKSLSFYDPEVRSAILDWHDGLYHYRRGEAAALRRCRDASKVLETTPAEVYRLRDVLIPFGVPSGPSMQLAAVAGLLANLKPEQRATLADKTETDDETAMTGGEEEDLEAEVTTSRNDIRKLGEAMGNGDPNRKGLHDLRFRRLLAVPDGDRDQLYRGLRPVLHFLDRQAPVLGVAQAAYYWGSRVRRELAYGFYTTKTSDS